MVANGAARMFSKAAEKGSVGQDPCPLLSASSPDERRQPLTMPTWHPLLAPTPSLSATHRAHLAPTPRPHTLSLRHSPCPPGALSSPPHPLSPPGVTHWFHPARGLISRLVAACSRVVFLCLLAVAPSFACPFLQPPPASSPLGACCLAFPLYPLLTFSLSLT